MRVSASLTIGICCNSWLRSLSMSRMLLKSGPFTITARPSKVHETNLPESSNWREKGLPSCVVPV